MRKIRSIKDSQGPKLEIGNWKLEAGNHFPFCPFPLSPFPASIARTDNDTIKRSPNHSMTRWVNFPFRLFPFSPFSCSSRFALSPFSLVTGLSVAGPLPPRLPGRGRPPPPSDCTPWPPGRRGRSSCRGTLRSSAPLSTAGRQERGSGLGACQFWILDFRFWIQQPRIVQSRLLTSAFGVLQS